jgi:hypothetical protein
MEFVDTEPAINPVIGVQSAECPENEGILLANPVRERT